MLRSALSQAHVEELVTKNVAALAKLPPLRKRKGNSWTSEQARMFLESSRDGDDYLYAAYVLVLVLGLPKGDVLGLTWDHIDWAGWNKKCADHGVDFCEQCRDRYDIGLRVDKQLQRVRGRLLHRQTKTEESDASLPLPVIHRVTRALRSPDVGVHAVYRVSARALRLKIIRRRATIHTHAGPTYPSTYGTYGSLAVWLRRRCTFRTR